MVSGVGLHLGEGGANTFTLSTYHLIISFLEFVGE